MLRIAVQKSGRLLEDSLQILKECGLKVDASNGKLKSTVANFPMEVLFLRKKNKASPKKWLIFPDFQKP